MKRTIKIASALLPCRGNSWDFENPKEVVYAVVFNPTKDEEEEAVAYAEEQYNLMGWQKCFVEPPKVIVI
jgi:hypothetical protein